jgi:hypothetical protein
MKKLFSLCLICLVAISAMAQEYVDLGLPSGTLWSTTNAGGDKALYTYEEAVNKFGDQLPSKEQWQELKDECTCSQIGNVYKVVGPNGNSITLPAAGSRSCDGIVSDESSYGNYWSSTIRESNYSWYVNFYLFGIDILCFAHCHGFSVRLVQ